jgi:hypothetical protein
VERAVAAERRAPGVSSPGIVPYGLSIHFCDECGQPLASRLWGFMTGCKTCDDAITRHRCERRPPRDRLAVGDSWTCPDCLSVWTATEEEDTCGECMQPRMVKTWDYAEGSQVATAPRHMPQPYAPFRDNIPRREVGGCYRMDSGSMVHVKPGCRCPK